MRARASVRSRRGGIGPDARAPAAPRRPTRTAAGGRDRWSLPLVILGLVAFGSFLSEGAAADWSAVYLRDEAGATSAVAAAGFAGFSIGMVAARFAGDRVVAAVGPALAAPGAATGILGFAVFGLGLGPVIPTAVSAAGNAGLGTLEGVVSRLFTIGYFGGVSGQAIIGFASSQVGLRAALLIPLCLVAGIVLASGRLSTGAGAHGPVEAGPGRARPPEAGAGAGRAPAGPIGGRRGQSAEGECHTAAEHGQLAERVATRPPRSVICLS